MKTITNEKVAVLRVYKECEARRNRKTIIIIRPTRKDKQNKGRLYIRTSKSTKARNRRVSTKEKEKQTERRRGERERRIPFGSLLNNYHLIMTLHICTLAHLSHSPSLHVLMRGDHFVE